MSSLGIEIRGLLVAAVVATGGGPLARAEKPRAAAVIAAPAATPVSRRAELARAALEALDRVRGVRPLRSTALREALIPSATAPDPVARADALATTAPLVAPRDPGARVRIYEQALRLVFGDLTVAQARSWLRRFGAAAAKTFADAGRAGTPLGHRLARWRGRPPAGGTGRLTLRVEPEDARVFLDGRAVGSGPRLELRQAPGDHDLTVELEGWAPARRRVTLGKGGTLSLRLERADPLADLRPLLAGLGAAHDDPAALLPLLRRLGRRLDVDLIFLCSPDAGATLVRLYDVAAGGFVAASPTTATDAATLARAFRASFELRGVGRPPPALRRTAKKRKRRRKGRRSTIRKLWKKWWFWAIVLGGAGAVTGAILLSQQGGSDGTLTIRLRRLP